MFSFNPILPGTLGQRILHEVRQKFSPLSNAILEPKVMGTTNLEQQH